MARDRSGAVSTIDRRCVSLSGHLTARIPTRGDQRRFLGNLDLMRSAVAIRAPPSSAVGEPRSDASGEGAVRTAGDARRSDGNGRQVS